MGRMQLAQVLAGIPLLPAEPCEPRPTLATCGQLEIAAVTADSRRVRPGTLFVAIKGTQADGNDFLTAAVQAGACAALTDRPERAGWLEVGGRRCPVLAVSDARLGLAEAVANLYGRPADHLRVVAITGTLGKTSTSHLLYSILQAAGADWRPGLLGSLGIRWGDRYRPSPLTTPDAVTLHETLAAMLTAGVRYPVLEVSSHAQMQHRVAGIRFAVAALLDLVPGEHADVHPDFQHYVQVKAKILAELQPGAPVVYNAGDPRVVQLLRQHQVLTPARSPGDPAAWPFVPVAFAGLDAISLDVNPWQTSNPAAARGTKGAPVTGGSVQLQDVELGSAGSRFRVVSPGRVWTVGRTWRDPVDFPCHLNLLGLHNAANALAAAATALTLGVPIDAIQEGLAQAQPFRRRMQVVYRDDFVVVDDTTGHPASFVALFHVVRLWQPHRVLLLTSIRGQRGEAINRANALAVAAGAKLLPIRKLVVTEAADCPDVHQRSTQAEVAAFVQTLRAEGVQYEQVATVAEAVARLLDSVQPGDLVLLAGTQNLDQAAGILQQRLEDRAGTNR